MVYKDYDYIYIRLNEMSKNKIMKFSNFISNIISLVRVWLVLSLKFILLSLIVDYWFN